LLYSSWNNALGIEPLCERARQVRESVWGRQITYSRKLFVPLTNMCRDKCGYCTFVQSPDSPHARVMTPDEVRASLRAGEKAGCKEVLFSLCEKPERRYTAARRALDRLGYERMTDYLAAMCDLVLRETSMIPHVNAGTLSDNELAKLRPVSASMGLMLESISKRLLRKGQPHHACPDKVPAQRLLTLERAGRHKIPLTTGILIGIGETWQERMESLRAINALHRRYGHIQEVIVQNFRAKPGTAMAHHPEPTLGDLMRTLAAARLELDADISLQVPPNLTLDHRALIDAGINDWGGISPVTSDFINPERAWPEIDALARTTAAAGHALAERLTVYPSYISADKSYLAPRLAERTLQLCREDGLAAHQYVGTDIES
jgi:FO synthase